eukprot:6134192-Amphidinium_carterae.1
MSSSGLANSTLQPEYEHTASSFELDPCATIWCVCARHVRLPNLDVWWPCGVCAMLTRWAHLQDGALTH